LVTTEDANPSGNSTTDVCYFNGVGLDGWEDLQNSKALSIYREHGPPALKAAVTGFVGGFIDALLYFPNMVMACDLPARCKEAYRCGGRSHVHDMCCSGKLAMFSSSTDRHAACQILGR
jgi:hypothetical protein